MEALYDAYHVLSQAWLKLSREEKYGDRGNKCLEGMDALRKAIVSEGKNGNK